MSIPKIRAALDAGDLETAERLAREKLLLVGISEDLFSRSPFELSGGQMRRVAIAGILAMEPEVLVLDEPTAGLDPAGRKELMEIFQGLHEDGMTIVLVTHLIEPLVDSGHVFDSSRGFINSRQFLKAQTAC